MQIKIRAILFILLSLFMMGGCRELKYKGMEKEQTEESPEPSIHIAGQEIPLSAQKVKLSPQTDEFDALEQLTCLKELDLSGCREYERIFAYMEAHPDVHVLYTVDLGNVEVSNEMKSAQPEGILEPDVLLQRLAWLPALESLDIRHCEYEIEDIKGFLTQKPDLDWKYTLRFDNETYDSELTRELDFSALSGEEVLARKSLLALLPNLTYVNLTNPEKTGAKVQCALTLEELGQLQTACPGVAFDWLFTVFGKTFSTADTAMDLKGIRVGNQNVDKLREYLPYMNVCTLLDMDGCNVSNKLMAQIREDFPGMKVVWRVRFGRYSCRTDARALRASTANPKATTAELSVLQYCTDMEMLDLGHNSFNNIEFVATMPNLRVAILAMSYVKDISPLANCPHLEYLELFSSFISDLSPLEGLTELEHLNIANNRIKDITPLLGMKQLKRLWIARNELTQEQIQQLRDALPDTEIDAESHNPTGGTWRKTERYFLLREQFHYDNTRWGNDKDPA